MPSTRPRRRLGFALVLSAAAAALVGVGSSSRADEFVDRVNNLVQKVPDDRRSDLVLLPLLAGMEKPPAVLKDQFTAALFANRTPNWAECTAWAQAEPQKKLLEALPKVTKDETDSKKGFVFGLPYGTSAPTNLIGLEMYADLGEPEVLAAAKLQYMDELENLGILVHVEASRLSEAGDVHAAMEIIKNWLFFTRQIADRQYLKEKSWAMQSMLLALERLSDVGYTDFRAEKHVLDPAKLASLIQLLRDRSLYLDRIKLPEAEFIGREQLISKVMIEKSGTNPATFASTMARISAVDRPLRLFSAAAFWEEARGGHADWYQTRATLKGLQDDWTRRWNLPAFDPFLARQTYYKLSVLGRPRYAVVSTGIGAIEQLFTLRKRIDAQQSGTRMGLAAYGYFVREKVLPITISATRPHIVKSVDADPYSSKKDEIQYFRAVTDTKKDAHGEPLPFEFRLFPPEPLPTMTIKLDSSQFVVYSVGPDDKRELALVCTQGREGVTGDYLFWPPELAMIRQRMVETGQLK